MQISQLETFRGAVENLPYFLQNCIKCTAIEKVAVFSFMEGYRSHHTSIVFKERVPFIFTAEDGTNATETEFSYFLDKIVLETDSAFVYTK